MSDLPDPNGTLARASFLGKASIPAGATSTTVNFPGPGHDFFFLSLWATWPHGGYEASRTARAITITWTVPAPDEGGALRWMITI